MNLRLAEIVCAVKDSEWIDARIGGQSTANEVREWLNMLTDEDFAEFMGRVRGMAKNCSILKKTMDIALVRCE